MAKQVADVQIHASESTESLDKEDYLDISVDLIDDNLYLGNLACARNRDTLKKLGITHILTVDVVPLPRSILDMITLTVKYVKLADVPKEDLISHLPSTNEFIQEALSKGGVVLVHCHFGVSRSAAVVMAYIMSKYQLCYDDALSLVKSKRRFVGPNVGFAAQLKLFGQMGYRIDNDDPRFKQFRLRLAGQKLKQVKILPHMFSSLVRPDPGPARERPAAGAVRCRRCGRVLAAAANLLPHAPRGLRQRRAATATAAAVSHQPPSGKHIALSAAENGQLLMEKLKSLASQINHLMKSEEEVQLDPQTASELEAGSSRQNTGELPEGESELHLVDSSVVGRDAAETCQLMWFVEPMSWMNGVHHETQGKLHCPKCNNKIGSFSWIMGCKCPCGQKVAPAFYLVPSKVEWSNIVQNVQVTL